MDSMNSLPVLRRTDWPGTRMPMAIDTIDPDTAWEQLLRRDPAAGIFYAVATTGVFCRLDCKSKRPLKANVRFFRTAEQARTAGYRPCLRCKPESTAQGNPLDRVR